MLSDTTVIILCVLAGAALFLVVPCCAHLLGLYDRPRGEQLSAQALSKQLEAVI